jgi:porphobilinogen deaminase
MYATHPNRYTLEQIHKLHEQGVSVEDISRQTQVEQEGILVHLAKDVPESKTKPEAKDK